MDINTIREIILILIKVDNIRRQKYNIKREQLAAGIIFYLPPYKPVLFKDLSRDYPLNHARSLLEFHSR